MAKVREVVWPSRCSEFHVEIFWSSYALFYSNKLKWNSGELFDMNASADFRQAVLEISGSVIKAAGGEIARSITQESLGDSVATVLATLAEESVAAIAGPVLRVILSVMTRDSASLQALLGEPALTGLREAQNALAIEMNGDRSISIRESRLLSADASLARAVTIALQSNDHGMVGVIYLIRALISLDMKSEQVAKNDLKHCISELNKMISALNEMKEIHQGDLDAMRAGRGSGYGLTRTGSLRSKIEQLDAQISPLVGTRDFAQSILICATEEGS
ncbi:MAG: hypothetical protein JNM58_05970 [Xanthomonadaceae bacterium]|nr:hypothetical protein [Xanthomonadaceae bacterium]